MLGVLKDDNMKLNYINFYGYLLRQIDAQIGTVVDELYKEFNGERRGEGPSGSTHGENSA